jgi:subtilisin family serine protease
MMAQSNFLTNRINFKIYNSSIDSLPSFDTSTSILNMPLELQPLIQKYGITKIQKIFRDVTYDKKLMMCYTCEFIDSNKRSPLINEMAKLSFVEFAENIPIVILDACSPAPTNEGAGFWNNSINSQWPLERVKFCNALPSYPNANNIKVGVIDNGTKILHSDLYNKIVYHYDMLNTAAPHAIFIPDYHGTTVAGIVGAENNNNYAVASIGKDCKLIVTNSSATGFNFNFESIPICIQNGAKIINCSWGSTILSKVHKLILKSADDNNVLIVAAAGNNNHEIGIGNSHYPAQFGNVFAVAGTADFTDNDGNSTFEYNEKFTTSPTDGSNYGDAIDIAAPGFGGAEVLHHTSPTSISINATSWATPIVSGAAAIVMAKFPTFNYQQVMNCLKFSSNANALYGNPYNSSATLNGKLGAGLLDIEQALNCPMQPYVAFTSNANYFCNTAVVIFTNSSFIPSGISILNYKWIVTDKYGNLQTSTIAT